MTTEVERRMRVVRILAQIEAVRQQLANLKTELARAKSEASLDSVGERD